MSRNTLTVMLLQVPFLSKQLSCILHLSGID